MLDSHRVPSYGYTICFSKLGQGETHNRLCGFFSVSNPNNMGGGTLYTMVYARLTSLTNHEVSFCAWDLPHLCVPSDGYTICFGELRGELGRDETHNRLYDSSRVSSPNNMGGDTLYTMVGCA